MIVEDGSGLSEANSFCTVAYASAYHAERGNDAWAAVVNKEAALVRATDYLEQVYGERWAGYRSSSEQALAWPRSMAPVRDSGTWDQSFYDGASVPRQVQSACAEMALRSVSGDLLADTDPTVASETVGPISTTYFENASKAKKYPAVDRLLLPLLASGGMGGALMLARA